MANALNVDRREMSWGILTSSSSTSSTDVISRPSSKSVVTISRMLPGVLPAGTWGGGDGFAMAAELTSGVSPLIQYQRAGLLRQRMSIVLLPRSYQFSRGTPLV